MIAFARRGDAITARFTTDEAALIQNLTAQLIGMLTERSDRSVGDEDPLAAQLGIGSMTAAPVDPALARLLPDAYRDDNEAASDYRRFTEVGLTERKIANARAVAMSLSGAPTGLRRTIAVRLDDPAVQAWLRTLTDLRLVLAERMEIVTDEDAAAERDEPMGMIFDWLGYLQATLLEEWEQ